MGKDPNAPKRNMSAYMLFCNANRAKTVKANPNLKMTQLSSVLAAMWNKTSEAQRKPFQAKSAKDKARYVKAMAAYKKTDNYKKFRAAGNMGGLIKKICKQNGIEVRGKPKKFPKDPNAPKRPSSSFFLWANDNRAPLMKKHNNDVAKVGKALGVGWKNVSEATKAKYQKTADKAKAKYATAMAKYEKTAKRKNYLKAKSEFAAAHKKAMKSL